MSARKIGNNQKMKDCGIKKGPGGIRNVRLQSNGGSRRAGQKKKNVQPCVEQPQNESTHGSKDTGEKADKKIGRNQMSGNFMQGLKQLRHKEKHKTHWKKQEKGSKELTTLDLEDMMQYSNDWVPLEWVKNGIIKTKDGRYIRIVEIEPITFLLRTPEERAEIIWKFYSWIKIAPNHIQIRIETTHTNADNLLDNMKNNIDKEPVEEAQQRGEEMLQHVKRLSTSQSLSKRFFIIYQYEGLDGVMSTDEQEIQNEMLYTEGLIRQFFRATGNRIISHGNETLFACDMLYKALNPNTYNRESLKDRVRRVNTDQYMMALQEGKDPNKTPIAQDYYVAPKGLDFTHAHYVICDGIYMTYLYVKPKGYRKNVRSAWFENFMGNEEGFITNIYAVKKDRFATIAETGRAGRFNRSRAKDRFRSADESEELREGASNADTIRHYMANYHEDLYDVVVLLTLQDESLKNLQKRVRTLHLTLRSMEYDIEDCMLHMEQATKMALPLLDMDLMLFEKAKRNFLSSSLASTYMFTAFEINCANGICIGVNRENSSLTVFDPFDTTKFQNANGVVLGTSGMGKSFFLMLLSYALRLKGYPVYVILPQKGYEWKRMVQAMGGSYVELAPGSKDCINLLAIRPTQMRMSGDDEDEEEEDDGGSLLSQKIRQITTFIQLLMTKDQMDDDEVSAISTVLTQMYEYFGITSDNDSIYLDKKAGILKPMPIMEDFYYRAYDNPILQRRICAILDIFVHGDANNMNGQTNVDLSNKLIVISVSKAGEHLLAPLSFISIDYCFDAIRADITQNCSLIIDENWSMMQNKSAGAYVEKIYRIIRGYGGSIITATQKLRDITESQFGSSIVENAKIKFILGMEKEDADKLDRILFLSESDKRIVCGQGCGEAYFFSNDDKVKLYIMAPPQWKELFEKRKKKRE